MPLIRLVTHLPRRALLVLLATLAFAALISGLHIDTDPENMLRDDQPARLFHNQVKQRFSLHDILVVGAVNETEGVFNPRSLAALNRLRLSLFLFYSPSDHDHYLRPQLELRPDDRWRITAGANLFDGDHLHTPFGQQGKASNLFLRLRYHY